MALGAGGDDDRLGAVLDAARPEPERPAREVHPLDVGVDDAGPETLRLLAEEGHQLRALDALREAGVVLDVARDHELAAAATRPRTIGARLARAA